MKALPGVLAAASLSLGGCPQLPPAPAVVARIVASTLSGPAPLRVLFSAARSTSRNGPIVQAHWDFAGLARADALEAAYTFAAPGRYTVTLTVTDSADQAARAAVAVRVQGGPATALIQADPLSGPAPLAVQFDGTGSGAADDAILDYFWDFGDGDSARTPMPLHTFEFPGTFSVQLRVVTFGGVEAAAATTILVEPGGAGDSGGGGASLEFAGGQFATLPLATDGPLSAFTFAAWFKAEAGGGLVRFGSPPLTLEVLPASRTVRFRHARETLESPPTGLEHTWHHLAVAADASAAVLYLDGLPIAAGQSPGQVAVTELILAPGFSGNVSAASFWRAALSADDVAAEAGGSDSATSGLLGRWPLNEGSGQTLDNAAAGGSPGRLGTSSAEEASDPSWSDDSP